MTTGRDARPLRWGVLGATSYVAQQAVLPALAAAGSARLVAVASESRGARGYPCHGAERAYASYAALLDDPDVEVVYVPLPNSLHRPWVERAAGAGKHVLCEKPLGLTASEAGAMTEACDRAGVRLLEAYVSPHHPRTAAVEALVRSGRLGDLRFARTAFTGTLRRGDDHRWRPETGGGALLDLGVYCVGSLLRLIGRGPERLVAAARMTPGGVDASFTGWLDFGNGLAASIECSFETPERQDLELVGTEGALVVDRAHTPGPSDGGFVLRDGQGQLRRIEVAGDDPYRLMVEQAHAVIREGAPATWTTAQSIATLQLLDRLRAAARAGALA
jgi:predicted dehydrogenase